MPDFQRLTKLIVKHALGGDTDTLACIAGAVAEAIHGLRREIADSARAYLTEDLCMILERFESAVRA